jgi:hypothetical protein
MKITTKHREQKKTKNLMRIHKSIFKGGGKKKFKLKIKQIH